MDPSQSRKSDDAQLAAGTITAADYAWFPDCGKSSRTNVASIPRSGQWMGLQRCWLILQMYKVSIPSAAARMQHICAICAHPIEPVLELPLENKDQEGQPVLTDTNQFDDWEKIIIKEYPQVIALPFRKMLERTDRKPYSSCDRRTDQPHQIPGAHHQERVPGVQ